MICGLPVVSPAEPRPASDRGSPTACLSPHPLHFSSLRARVRRYTGTQAESVISALKGLSPRSFALSLHRSVTEPV